MGKHIYIKLACLNEKELYLSIRHVWTYELSIVKIQTNQAATKAF